LLPDCRAPEHKIEIDNFAGLMGVSPSWPAITQAAGIEHKRFAQDGAGDGNALCCPRKPQGGHCTNKSAVGKREVGRRVAGLRDELMVSVRPRIIFEDAPLQAFTHRLWVGGGKKGP